MGDGRCYEFGPFLLDTSDQRLFYGDEPVGLTRLELKVLLILVESKGQRIVTKDYLMSTAWPDAIVEEGALYRVICDLKGKLKAEDPLTKYIKAEPKLGYSFKVKPSIVQCRSRLAKSLLDIIEPSKVKCRERRLRYHTPHLLLALLTARDNFTKQCFDNVEKGLADKITAKLKKHIDEILQQSTVNGGDENHTWADFYWRDLGSIKRAIEFAEQEENSVVTVRHVLLGILHDNASRTTTGLKGKLGVDRFEQLINIAKNVNAGQYSLVPTPDNIYNTGQT